jgi:hypothetical protein
VDDRLSEGDENFSSNNALRTDNTCKSTSLASASLLKELINLKTQFFSSDQPL